MTITCSRIVSSGRCFSRKCVTAWSVYTHLLEIARHHGVPSQLLGYARAQSFGCGRLTVNDINDLRSNRGELQPVEDFPLIGVRGEAGDIDNFRGGRDVGPAERQPPCG